MTTLVYSKHAEDRLADRNISKADVEKVLADPDVDQPRVRGGRIYARRVGERRITVVVATDTNPYTVVTVWAD
jgi:hypothetical protein